MRIIIRMTIKSEWEAGSGCEWGNREKVDDGSVKSREKPSDAEPA